MTISVTDLAKKLEIAPEAVYLHTRDLGISLEDDEMISEEDAAKIKSLEVGDEIAQVEHEIEEQIDREIIEKQQASTAGQKKVVRKKKNADKEEEEEVIADAEGNIILPETINIRDLSKKIKKPLPMLLVKLKQNGIIANLKEDIDYETAAIIASDLGVKVKKELTEMSGEDLFQRNFKDLLGDEEAEDLIPRYPVISVMGHIDHGKTSLLDYMRSAKVTESEAGGITQSIGAYQIYRKDKKITFLDTPGHEAFTTMRARGAKITDIAILVVAATEGLKSQSIEAINHAKEAEIPIIVAINKMDLEGANPEQVKGELAEQGLNPEDWGGDTICIPISAKTGLGIDTLLDAIEIVAEDLKLQANPHRNAIATVIESVLDKKIGYVTSLLVNTGTLNQGDNFVIYDHYGRVKRMTDFTGKITKSAGPSDPVVVVGISGTTRSGDILQVMDSEKMARKKSEEVGSIVHTDKISRQAKISFATLKNKIKEDKMHQCKFILKSDAKGSLDAAIGQIQKHQNDQALAKIIHSGVGEITESDIMLARSSDAILLGFNLKASFSIIKLADQEDVSVFCFDVIYHLSEKVEKILQGSLDATPEESIIGKLAVKKVFASNKKFVTLGGEVVDGVMNPKITFRLLRDPAEGIEPTREDGKVLIGTGTVDSIHLGPESVNKVEAGTECGLKLIHSDLLFQEGDGVELFLKRKK